MRVLGYIFPGQSSENARSVEEQQRSIEKFAMQLGKKVERFYIEEEASLKRAFQKRRTGSRMLEGLESGDIVIAEKTEWVLGSARSGLQLIAVLKDQAVSLYCVDLQEDLVLPGERKLVVSEGGATLIQKILASLTVCQSSKHGAAIRAAKNTMREEGKYLGGPVPFGWRVAQGRLIKNREEQKVIREIMKLRANRWSYRDIGAIVKEKYNLTLSHEGIRKIVINQAKDSCG